MSDAVTTARTAFDAYRARVRHNYYDSDPHLASLLRHYGRLDDADAIRAFGEVSALQLDALVMENNRDEHLPRLRSWDGHGHNVEQVDFHPSYHDIGRAAYGSGLMQRYGTPGQELQTLALEYMLAINGEAGHACPIACTAGLIKILQTADDFPEREAWLQRLLDPNYDTHFHGSQFLTEVQGGSDVGANTVVAHDHGDGSWRIEGEKWFCSVVDAHLFLVTARPVDASGGTKGLGAFVVPRVAPDGGVNHFTVRRLKYKLGTRSMASAEVDFHGAWARPVGDFRRVVELVLNTSRLYNAICSSGIMQRSWLEADAYARERHAFGHPILGFPAVAQIVARLRVEAYAARSVTFLLADINDQLACGERDATKVAAHRMLVNCNKFWTAIEGTTSARDAIEVLGGNGTIEEFSVLPRLLRDAVVCEAWEGGHNVLCAQVLKDAKRLELHLPMFGYLESLSGPFVELDAARERFERVVAMPAGLASAHIRDVIWELRTAAQLAALRAEAATAGTDPVLPAVIAHLRALRARGYDPLADEGLAARVAALV